MLSLKRITPNLSNEKCAGNPLIRLVLVAPIALVLRSELTAQTFTTLHSFSGGIDGAEPEAGLILSGNTLYGTAYWGGSPNGSGTVFSLTLDAVVPRLLTLTPADANVILTWPTNFTNFTLQSTTNPVVPAVWTAVSKAPFVVNGQNTVTNPVSGTQQFFRLSQ